MRPPIVIEARARSAAWVKHRTRARRLTINLRFKQTDTETVFLNEVASAELSMFQSHNIYYGT